MSEYCYDMPCHSTITSQCGAHRDIEMGSSDFLLMFFITHLVISHRFVLVERFEAFLVDCRKVNKDVLGSIICIYQRSVR